MIIAVFGATGGTGRQFVHQALAAGYQIKALVRRTAVPLEPHERLAVVEGDVLDPAAVSKTVAGVNAVVVALGTAPGGSEVVCSQGTQHIVQAMEAEEKARRLVVVTSLGVGDSANQVPFFFKLLMKTALRGVMADKEAQEAIVRASGLDWIIVRPGGLTDGPPAGDYRVGTGPDIGAGQISRADLAAFLLSQLTDNIYLRQMPAIT